MRTKLFMKTDAEIQAVAQHLLKFGPIEVKDLAGRAGISAKRAYECLGRMSAAGTMKRVRKGVYDKVSGEG